jgi:hypothetical protein
MVAASSSQLRVVLSLRINNLLLDTSSYLSAFSLLPPLATCNP